LGEFALLELAGCLNPPRRPIASTLANSGRAIRQFAWIIRSAETVSCVIAIS
jgi:hypothetical protein